MPKHDWTVMPGGRVECSRCHYLRECSHHDRNHPDEQCDDCNGPCPTTPTPDPKALTEEKRYTFPPSEPMDDAQCDTINPWTGAGFHNWTADERRLWATIDSLRARAEQAERDRDEARGYCDDLCWMMDRCHACGHRLRFEATGCPQCLAKAVAPWNEPKEMPDTCKCDRCAIARAGEVKP